MKKTLINCDECRKPITEFCNTRMSVKQEKYCVHDELDFCCSKCCVDFFNRKDTLAEDLEKAKESRR